MKTSKEVIGDLENMLWEKVAANAFEIAAGIIIFVGLAYLYYRFFKKW